MKGLIKDIILQAIFGKFYLYKQIYSLLKRGLHEKE